MWIVYSLRIVFLKLHNISASKLEVLVTWCFPLREYKHTEQEFVTTSEDKECELKHVHNAFRTNGYMEWAFVVPKQGENETYISQQRQYRTSLHRPKVCRVYQKDCQKHSDNTVSVCITNPWTLYAPSSYTRETRRRKKCGVIYEITCDQDPAHVHIGETKCPLGKRFKEHTNLIIPTSVGGQCNATGHSVSLDNTKELTGDPQLTKRKVKEAIQWTSSYKATFSAGLKLADFIPLSRVPWSRIL